MYRCESCGFSYELDRAEGAGDRLLAGVLEMNDVVRRLDDPGVRPEPATWSPLEYLCHVRDVLLVQRERVLQARREDVPSFAPMGRDERVEHDGGRPCERAPVEPVHSSQLPGDRRAHPRGGQVEQPAEVLGEDVVPGRS